MSEEEKKAIEWLKNATFFSARLYAPSILNLIEKQQEEIDTHIETENDYEHELARKDEEIEELRGTIKAEKVLNENIPEDTQMIIMSKKDFLRNYETSYISKDTIKEIIEKHYPDIVITKLYELLDE